jgi:hypothetical protein
MPAVQSAAFVDPNLHVGRFQGLAHDTGQVVSDRLQIHGVFQPRGERDHGPVGVVSGPVEPAVHPQLHPAPAAVPGLRRGPMWSGRP